MSFHIEHVAWGVLCLFLSKHFGVQLVSAHSSEVSTVR
jgi:hypothetical protein